VPEADVVFAGLERFAGLTDDGGAAVSGISAGAELWSEPLLAGSGTLGGAAVGGATGCAAGAGGTAAGVTSRSAPGDGAFREAQPETARITRNPVITGGCIDGSIGMPGDPTP
jgi:hypothetical protein